jgi:hypothetical protein
MYMLYDTSAPLLANSYLSRKLRAEGKEPIFLVFCGMFGANDPQGLACKKLVPTHDLEAAEAGAAATATATATTAAAAGAAVSAGGAAGAATPGAAAGDSKGEYEYVVRWHKALHTVEDLAVLSECDHFILTLGTFAWWPALVAAPSAEVVVMRRQLMGKRAVEEVENNGNEHFYFPGGVL